MDYSLHTIFSTECKPYFDWQSLGVYYSFRKVGMPGKITRLSACEDPPGKGGMVSLCFCFWGCFYMYMLLLVFSI